MKKQPNRARRKPPVDFDDNPPLSDAMLRRMRPAREVMPKIVAAYEKRVGRPPHGERAKVPLSLRIDPQVLDAYKASGEGWQSRMGEVLARGAKKLAKAGH